MNLSQLNAISPIDGRYRVKTEELSKFFSEGALMRYRVLIEIEYFIALSDLPELNLTQLTSIQRAELRLVYTDLTENDLLRIKEFECVTNHDVKAVEYFVKEKIALMGLSVVKEFVHFGLTSQDINNTAIPLMLKESMLVCIQPVFDEIIGKLNSLAKEWANVPMLAHTHGQPATPTTLGKEMLVFVVRIQNQIKQMNQIPYSAKFGGATGNLNAHNVAFPDIDWNQFAEKFVSDLGLSRSFPTTQIEHYDNLAAFCDAFKRINNILIDLSRDVWVYVSMNYFNQKIVAGEVGSSAMPHKINPIDFENAEGNLGFANAIFEHFASKLPVSRLQRDLTDSTVLRNIGVPIAHSLIAYKSLLNGLGKLIVNFETIENDLESNWVVVTEAISTILRREGFQKPYETIRDWARTNNVVTKEGVHGFIEGLDVSIELKAELKAITPQNYVGVIVEL